MNQWKLLEPVVVGTKTLKNRIVMAPMCTRLASADGSVTQKMIDYYAARAKGGAGTIIVEYSYTDNRESRAAISQLGVESDHKITGLAELAEAVKLYGTAILLQICHAGRQTAPSNINGKQPVAPSAIPCKLMGVMPRELTIEEIEQIEDDFAEAARRAKQAGFDGVEIHGAHGYLVCQFLSPYTNRRTDKYGGSLENRAQFAVEIINKIRAKVGKDFIVGCRISADEYIPGGLKIEETTKIAKILEQAGLDYIHVSGGMYESLQHNSPTIYYPRAYYLSNIEAIKKAVNIPVLGVGAFNVELAEKVLKEGKADLIVFGRALIADPELPKKVMEGRVEDIRLCIRGEEGCISRFFEGKTIRCEVNPAVGRESEFVIKPASTKKRVLVIGGGVAGLEAARVAALRGHEVTLVEREDKLGGHLIEASTPPFKDDLKQLLNWLVKQVEKAGVKVELKTEATKDLVSKLKPDVLIIAVGSDFIMPSLPGVDKPFVLTPSDVILGKKPVGQNAVVVGGGLVGCETALYIASVLGKKVKLIEMLDMILPDVDYITRVALSEKLSEAGVEVLTGMHLEEITEKGVLCIDKSWNKHKISADTVVLAVGLSAREKVAESFKGLAPEVYMIGDCVKPRK
ncbi:MAG: NAD(P)/FAD-dependent oxidoreductase, partial [Candidatus Korarchaeum sp.]|nr:NAD(P)/FAD-dependent oxidoreductase [Candidatus Korarchaeum sp.]MDW8035389.1 NAD(P)/FAD-dependent oxidoreductase [Candidatus Korarchaeum sp.]